MLKIVFSFEKRFHLSERVSLAKLEGGKDAGGGRPSFVNVTTKFYICDWLFQVPIVWLVTWRPNNDDTSISPKVTEAVPSKRNMNLFLTSKGASAHFAAKALKMPSTGAKKVCIFSFVEDNTVFQVITRKNMASSLNLY